VGGAFMADADIVNAIIDVHHRQVDKGFGIYCISWF
jgi:hypothetical protein